MGHQTVDELIKEQMDRAFKGRIFAFLNETETEVDDFSRKVMRGSWLRPALVSHLCYLYQVDRAYAETMIDEWIEEEQ